MSEVSAAQSVTKEELSMIAFEIIAYSGDARSKLLEAVKNAKNKNIPKNIAPHLLEFKNSCL